MKIIDRPCKKIKLFLIDSSIIFMGREKSLLHGFNEQQFLSRWIMFFQVVLALVNSS
jgi:hypothetical protein